MGPIARMTVEALLIVVSILLAFAIDTWWDERQDRAEESEILDLLQAEYRANVEHTQRIIDAHLGYTADVEDLLDSSDAEIQASPPEALSRYVLALCNPWTFDPVLGTTDALISAGKLDILSERQLRVALTTYVNQVDDAAEDAAYLVSDAKNMWLAEIDAGGPWTSAETEIGFFGEIPVPDFIAAATTEDVLRIRQDQRLMGTVKRCHINVGYYLTELHRLKAQANKVLELIEQSR